MIYPTCIIVTLEHLFWVSSKHPVIRISVETLTLLNTNHILKLLTQQHLTVYQFVAAWGVSISRCLCSQGEEALVLRKCFKGVQRDGDLIQVRDTVLLKSGPRKKSLPYVAKISALWEDPESGGICSAWLLLRTQTRSSSGSRSDLRPVLVSSLSSGELMMSLFWYYRPEHTQGGRNPSLHCEVRSRCF